MFVTIGLMLSGALSGIALGFYLGWCAKSTDSDGWEDEALWWRAQHERALADQQTNGACGAQSQEAK